MEILRIDKNNDDDEEIKIERAKIEGIHLGIKRVIEEIENIERFNSYSFIKTDESFIRLKNELGILVYKNWPQKN